MWNLDKRFIALAAIILFVHMATFLARLHHDSAVSTTTTPQPAPALKLVPLTPGLLEKYQRARQQIVQNDDTGRKEKPKDQAFLGEKDMSYDRQTMARKVDVFNKAGKGSVANTTAEAKPSEPKPAVAKKKALKDLKLSDVGFQAAGVPEPKREPSQAGKRGIAAGDERSQGVSSTNDYVEHVQLGDFTQLNTVEYKYYGFFHRIRQKLEQFWGRSLHEKAEALWKSGRRLPASDNYTTALVITMDGEGQILKVQVKSSSGVRELDDAAIESFNKAGPFPNPPRGLVVDGRATIEWGFVVKS